MPRTQVTARQLAADDHAVVSDSGGTVTVDCSSGQQTVRAEATLTGTGRTVALSGDSNGQRVELVLRQDGTGSRTVTTWPATVNWRSGAAPTLRTAAGAVDVVVLVRLASGEYLGYHDAASGGGGGGSTLYSTTATVDFGARGGVARATLTGLSWANASRVMVCQAVPNASHGAEDVLLEQLVVTVENVVNGVGFDVVAHAPNTAFGQYAVNIIAL